MWKSRFVDFHIDVSFHQAFPISFFLVLFLSLIEKKSSQNGL